ncbi:histidine phosphatase family protein [Corynebacterium lubricantis]|uniref:histidine phosphatase family protein n=1 Tax=Corynebacterium lubricantis TaxID=541095 RepID=UPI00036B6937|nr:histidine phosphatase family protein [Corynebacterium lubricantis]
MKLVLIRHGSTDWNIERRMQGSTDIAICDQGREESARLAPFLQTLEPGYVVTSQLQRTIQTAEAAGLSIDKSDPRLNEFNLGVWEGQLIDDIDQKLYGDWVNGEYAPEGGDDMSEFFLRINAAIFDAMSHAGANNIETVCVVAHGGVIRRYLARGLGLDTSKMVNPRHASASIVDFDGHRMRLEAYNYLGL